MRKSNHKLHDLWDTLKSSNMCIIGVSERLETDYDEKQNFEENIADELLNLIF